MTYRRGWKTVLEVDFSQQPNQTFITDGTYTIAGLTWTKGNSANEATHSSIINGTGLNFQPASTSFYDGGTRTLPYLWLSFSQVFQNYGGRFGWNTGIRLWVSIGSDNPAANFDLEIFGFDSNSDALTGINYRGFVDPSGTGGGSQLSISGGNTTISLDLYTLSSTSKTYVIEASSPQLHKISSYRAGSISAGTPFPPLSIFQPTTVTFMGTTKAASMVNIGGTTLTNPGSMGILLGGQRDGSGTAFSFNYQRIRLDALFNDL
jgi:hypothetical protein